MPRIDTITLKLNVSFNGRIFPDANEVLASALEALADDIRCYSDRELSGRVLTTGNRVELGTFEFTNTEA